MFTQGNLTLRVRRGFPGGQRARRRGCWTWGLGYLVPFVRFVCFIQPLQGMFYMTSRVRRGFPGGQRARRNGRWTWGLGYLVPFVRFVFFLQPLQGMIYT